MSKPVFVFVLQSKQSQMKNLNILLNILKVQQTKAVKAVNAPPSSLNLQHYTGEVLSYSKDTTDPGRLLVRFINYSFSGLFKVLTALYTAVSS